MKEEEKCQFQRGFFHTLQPKPLQRMCRWGGEEKQTREWSSEWEEAGSRPCCTQDTRTHQIERSTCQGCTDTRQCLSSQDKLLSATRLRLPVFFRFEEYWFCSFSTCYLLLLLKKAPSQSPLALSTQTQQCSVELSGHRMFLFIHCVCNGAGRKINLR